MLIAFEGIDGSGKSTAASLTVEGLRQLGPIPSFIPKRGTLPVSTPEGARQASIRDVIWNSSESHLAFARTGRHPLHLYASWFYLLEQLEIAPALAEKKIVVCDNWYFKFASKFLSSNREIDEREVFQTFAGLVSPDVVLYVDVPAEVAVVRKGAFEPGDLRAGEGGSSSFVSYQSTLRSLMQDWASRFGWVTIDGTSAASDVAAECVDAVTARYHTMVH